MEPGLSLWCMVWLGKGDLLQTFPDELREENNLEQETRGLRELLDDSSDEGDEQC